MASLTGNQVGASYLGIIKTLDNTAITASPKQLSDGAGNALTVCASSSSLIFTGTADFSAATVTGIPTTDTTYDLGSAQSASNVNLNLTGSDATVDTITLVAGSNVTLTDDGSNNVTIAVAADTDTTYDLASAQAGSDVNVNLTGSDATTDTVKFAAGTNITLTDNGSNQITIDASGGAAGLVSGTGTDSLKNADSLVTNPATASGNCSIALGDNAQAYADCSIVIGHNACDFDVSRVKAIAIGCNAAPAQCGIAIGSNTRAVRDGVSIGSCATNTANDSVAIGCGALVTGGSCDSISIGRGAQACGLCTTSIGQSSNATGNDSISIGRISCAIGNCSIAIGFNTQVFDAIRPNAIAIGNSARVTQESIAIGCGANTSGGSCTIALGFRTYVNGNDSIAIGCCANTFAVGSVALGRGVCATRANYVTSCAFEACVVGQGLVVTSPDGLTTLGIGIDNSGNIVTYTP
jgi:hypothetical protein